jgi:single-stranded DNA-binding protein
MHRISIIGKLTSNPVLNCNGKLSSTFTVEVMAHTKNSKTIFYNVTACGTNARFVLIHAHMGTQVMVVGTPIVASNYENSIPDMRITINAVLVRIIDSYDSLRDRDALHQYYSNVREI